MSRRRVATTWEPGTEPDLEAYIAAHSDNVSAAIRRALKVGIKAMQGDESVVDRIDRWGETILARLDNLTIPERSTVEVTPTDDGEISLSDMPSDIISRLKGIAG